MPKLRQIKPEFWDDAELGRMPPGARLMFICTWNLADDFGNLRGDSRYLLMRAFGFDESVTARHVGQWIRLLVKSGHLQPYDGLGTSGFHVRGFGKHQATRKAKLYRQVAPSPFDEIPHGYEWQDELETVLIRTRNNPDTHAREGMDKVLVLPVEGESEGDDQEPTDLTDKDVNLKGRWDQFHAMTPDQRTKLWDDTDFWENRGSKWAAWKNRQLRRQKDASR